VAKVRLAMAAMGQPKTKVADLCRELGVTRQTLYIGSPRILMAAFAR
jgi:AcrR family transcriptional regulator